MFSLLWSEHCAYKHSRKLLRRLPTEGERVVMGPGENAGAVDIGAGHAIAFKVESHNHPSAVEPFQGAATGVGGILRDVFALGARPIAILDSLRFGELDSVRSRHLLDGAVRGIGHYGNSIGVPTVGGEIYFEAPYEHNCLVNAMCVGIAKQDEMVRAAAAGVGNAVVLIGASTGRDGIGGASVLASAELGEGDEGKRPTVQIGDPFEESKVLECCLELLGKGLLVSLQDLGAAGLTSSASEMASAGGVGIDLDVGRVPLREADMEPFEIMVSESQERMLAVVEPARVAEVLAVCEKWQTGGAEIGAIAAHDLVRVLRDGEVVGEMPVDALVDGCPLYDLEPAAPEGWIYGNRATLAPGVTAEATLLALLGAPSVASKRWAFEQYDSIVGSRTARRPESADAAVLAIPEADRGDRDLDRRQRAAGRLRPLRRHGRGGARVRPEPRLRRRRAARPDQLPQLRQPREAGPRLAARPRRAGPRRRLRGARGAGRRRQRLALQRGAGRADLPDPGGRHGRRAARPRSWPRRAPSPPPATRSRCSARSNRASRAPSWPSSAASSTPGSPSPTSPPSPPPARPCATRSAPASSPAPTTSATAASPAPSPRRRSAPGSAARSTSSTCASAAARPRRRSSARAPGASSSAASATSSKRWPARASRCSYSARWAATTVELAAGDRSLSVAARRRRARPGTRLASISIYANRQ